MSYAITIQRPGGRTIEYDEWLEVAHDDPELVHAGYSEWKGPDGRTVRYEVFAWTPDGTRREDEEPAVFVYFDGAIVVDHAADDWTAKIGQVAVKLNAEAVGDDGETHDARGNASYPEPPARPGGWWKRIFG